MSEPVHRTLGLTDEELLQWSQSKPDSMALEEILFTANNLVECDDASNDGIENFDLSIQNEQILSGQDAGTLA